MDWYNFRTDIFFILFINDLALHLPNNSFIMYADDITLFTSNKCLFEAESQLQLYVNIYLFIYLIKPPKTEK